MKAGASGGGSARRRHAVGLSLKIWSDVAPICRARRAAGRRPRATARCIPTRGAPSGQVRRRRGCGLTRDSVVVMDVPGLPGPNGADLLSVALLVFFVSLILTVAALLA